MNRSNSVFLSPQVPAALYSLEEYWHLVNEKPLPISFESTLQRKHKLETIFDCLTVYISKELHLTPRKPPNTLSWCFLSDLSSFCSFAEKEQLRQAKNSNYFKRPMSFFSRTLLQNSLRTQCPLPVQRALTIYKGFLILMFIQLSPQIAQY